MMDEIVHVSMALSQLSKAEITFRLLNHSLMPLRYFEVLKILLSIEKN